MNIPKIIHQIWFQGVNELPVKYKPHIKLLKQLNPNWKYILWDEKQIENILQTYYMEYYDLYKNFHYMHQKIDFFKYIILYHMGGIYVDMDVIAIKPFDGLIRKFPRAQLIVSTMPINKLIGFVLTGTSCMINNGTILSVPHHEFLLKLLQEIKKYTAYDWSMTKFTKITNTTGPKMFSYMVNKNKHSDITIIDHKYLEPCYGLDNSCTVTPNAYVNHVHEQTWIPESYVRLIRFYYDNKFIFIVVCLIILFALINRILINYL
jgi:mannosyltransferase OCH1-like enzyme